MTFYYRGGGAEDFGADAKTPYVTEQHKVRNRMSEAKDILKKNGYTVYSHRNSEIFYSAIRISSEYKTASFITNREYCLAGRWETDFLCMSTHESLSDMIEITRNHKIRKLLDL